MDRRLPPLIVILSYDLFAPFQLVDLMVKVYYGEFRITPASTVDMYSYFSNMYQWLSDNELTGRFIFDLGQALYEGFVGQMIRSLVLCVKISVLSRRRSSEDRAHDDGAGLPDVRC